MSRQKFKIGLWVFTLGVLLAVLRPFVAYQLGPRANLQRLVKKKEERHDVYGEAVISTQTQSTIIPKLSKWLSFLGQSWFMTNAKPVILRVPTYIPVQHQLYRLSSCFLI